MKKSTTITTRKFIKSSICFALVAQTILSPLSADTLPFAGALDFGITAYADNSGGIVYYPRCNWKYNSFVDALKSIGVNSSYASRKNIAAVNSMPNYTGTAAQNSLLLNALKSGLLIKSRGSNGSSSPNQSKTPLNTNLSKVKYIKQASKTCKASSVAMAINIIEGKNDYTTSKMGSSNCSSIQNKQYKGSNGITYIGVYKTDGYIGSAAEQKLAIDNALSLGVPIVVAVHSTMKTKTQHHWVVIIGKAGSDYIIIDPASGGNGTVSNCTTTMTRAKYVFGLADYKTLHYGYVTFNQM